MNIKQTVALNLSADGIPPRLHMVQGDSNSRTIVATLWDGAQAYKIPTGSAIMMRFRKPDGTGGLYDTTEGGAAITFSGSNVTAPVSTQVLAVAGTVYAEFDIYGTGAGASADRLATFRFIIEVADNVYPDAEIISSDYYNVLASKFVEAAAAAASASSSAEAAAASAEAATSAALHTPRVGTDGCWEVWDFAEDKYVSTGYPAIGSPAAFDVDASGNLRLYYTGDTAPDYSINKDGHLILQLDEDTYVDLGLVRGTNGVDGKSAYASATDGGYTGSEETFNRDLANTQNAVRFNTAQELTAAQQAQARENIGALGASDDVAKESTSQLILAAVNGLTAKRYGYRVKENEADPSSRVEYLFDAVGMTPAAMNYTAGAFSYGSWADVWFVRDNVPYMVNNDGSVAYQLDPNDYTKKAVTGAASDVANTAFGGNAMSAIPLVWVKRYQENGYRYVIFCETQYDEDYKAYAHTRPDGTISPFAYGPMFEGSKVDTKLRSLSGQVPVSNLNATQELTAAQANGDAWTLTTWAFWNLIHDLLVLLGKSTNIQEVFGQGHTTGGSSAADLLTTGALNTKGQFFGYSDTTHSVKVFHMENFWGDRWDRLVGLIYDNGTYKVKMTPEGGGYNLTGAGYEAVRKGINATEAGGGWVKNAQQTEQGLFPTVLGGSDATYDCDYHYYNPAVVSVPVVGGPCSQGSFCGRFLYGYYTAASSGWHVGASLFLQNPS